MEFASPVPYSWSNGPGAFFTRCGLLRQALQLSHQYSRLKFGHSIVKADDPFAVVIRLTGAATIGIHVGHVQGQMNGNNKSGPGREGHFDSCRIYAIRVRQYVNKDRDASQLQHRSRRSFKGVGGDNHFVTRFEPQRAPIEASCTSGKFG